MIESKGGKWSDRWLIDGLIDWLINLDISTFEPCQHFRCSSAHVPVLSKDSTSSVKDKQPPFLTLYLFSCSSLEGRTLLSNCPCAPCASQSYELGFCGFFTHLLSSGLRGCGQNSIFSRQLGAGAVTQQESTSLGCISPGLTATHHRIFLHHSFQMCADSCLCWRLFCIFVDFLSI